MVVGDPGADRAAACSPAARRQGAELGTQRRPASVGSEHGNLYGRTESLVAVLRRPRFPPRRATPRRRWAHYGRAWPTEHEPVRSQHGFVAYGRWYPTNTTLPNGEVLTVAGTDQNGAVVTIPEIWNGTSWRQLTTASLSLEYYPRDFVAPDGRVFDAGEEQPSRWLDVTGTGRWTDGPSRNEPGWRSYGSAVMYEPGKNLYAGGGEDPPTNTAEVIDVTDASPDWRYTGSMAYARRHMNATILPTGDVLVTGGTSAPGFNNFAGAVHVAELWN